LWTAANLVVSIYGPAEGEFIKRYPWPEPTEDVYDSIISNCEADKKLCELLDRKVNGDDPIVFNALVWNCQNWSAYYFKRYLE
jgi:hypothetical protein